MLLGISLSDIGIHIFDVLVLFVFLRWLLYKPIVKYMKKRQDSFASKIEELDAREKEVIQQKEQYDRLMAEADGKAAQIINRSKDIANENAKMIVDYSKEYAKDIVIRAKNEIEAQKLQAEAELRAEITNLAVMLAEKVLEREVSVKDNEKVIGEFFERVG